MVEAVPPARDGPTTKLRFGDRKAPGHPLKRRCGAEGQCPPSACWQGPASGRAVRSRGWRDLDGRALVGRSTRTAALAAVAACLLVGSTAAFAASTTPEPSAVRAPVVAQPLSAVQRAAVAARANRARADRLHRLALAHRIALARQQARNARAHAHALAVHHDKVVAARHRAAVRAAAQRAAARRAAAHRASRSAVRSIAPSTGVNRRIGQALAAKRGWTGDQWTCLNNLWTKESGWSTQSGSPGSAYGIPQALPGTKMASAGPNWRTDAATQIRWGMGYISGRYGKPCGAWRHWQSHGWY